MDINRLKIIFNLILVGLPILVACSSLSSKQREDHYHYLFDKNVETRFNQDCIAAYYRGSLLFFFASYFNKIYKATVYNPSTGEFAEFPIINQRKASCRDLPFKYQEPMRTQWIRVGIIQSKGFRKVFDRYKQDPKALRDAINAIPSAFRKGGKWKGEITFSLTNKTIEANKLEDVVEYFLSHPLTREQSTNCLVCRKRLQ